MKFTAVGFWAAGVSVLVLTLVAGITCIGISNGEVRLRNAIKAKQEDNKSEFDNMFKKIAQTTQVAKFDRDSLLRIFVEHAGARKVGGENQLMTWVKESIPNVDPSCLKNLMNIIVSSRDQWTMRQKEILDLKREHDNLRGTWPGSWIVGGRPEIQVTIVTSTKTEKAFGTGKDDDVDMGLQGK
jgi:hypothetical protein